MSKFNKEYFDKRGYLTGKVNRAYNYDKAIWLHNMLAFHTLMDIGCGYGLLIDHLYNLKHDVLALDKSGYILDEIKEKHPHIETEIAGLPLLDDLEEHRKFDVVHCAGVLEYLTYYQVISSIKTMLQRVRKGGWLVIDTIPENQKSKDPLYKSVHESDWWVKKLTKKPFHFTIIQDEFNGTMIKHQKRRKGLFIIKND